MEVERNVESWGIPSSVSCIESSIWSLVSRYPMSLRSQSMFIIVIGKLLRYKVRQNLLSAGTRNTPAAFGEGRYDYLPGAMTELRKGYASKLRMNVLIWAEQPEKEIFGCCTKLRCHRIDDIIHHPCNSNLKGFECEAISGRTLDMFLSACVHSSLSVLLAMFSISLELLLVALTPFPGPWVNMRTQILCQIHNHVVYHIPLPRRDRLAWEQITLQRFRWSG